ncbi:MAG: PxxKW family cysteine-rich protein [Thermodesulfobacteriota bacterium]|jgi:hypothetical protein
MAKAAQTQGTEKYVSGAFQPVIDKCEGCGRIVEANAQRFCQAYAVPSAKWRLGICNFATHVKPEIVTAKTRVNPLKASKRAAAGKK